MGGKSSESGVSRRILGIAIVIGILIAVGGVVASGLVSDPVDDALGNGGGDSVAKSDTENGSSMMESDIPREAFTPPINSTALREANVEELEAAGSFTVVDEFSVESESSEIPSRENTFTSTYDLDNARVLTVFSTDDRRVISYQQETEKYQRIEYSSGETEYGIPDRDLTADPFTESEILNEFEAIDLEHRETDDGHVYTANGVDAVSGEFLGGDSDSFRAFEFEAVVSDRGTLTSFSFRIDAEEDDGSMTVITRAVEIKEVGTTEVRDPSWLAEARAATN
ncbi:MAG: hypothetical protein V5A36_03125 [Natronomonas sp.]